MSRKETIEYYDTCPNCGGASNGATVCPYCDTSLVKSKVVTDYELSLEEEMRQEDAGLPLRHVKSGKVSSFMKFFCPLFGGIFVAVPTILCVAFAGVGMMEWFMIPFFGLFWAIGLGALIPFGRAVSAERKCRRSPQVTGTVRGYSPSSYMINGASAKTVRVRLEGPSPELIEFDTGSSATPYALGQRITLRTNGTHFMIE